MSIATTPALPSLGLRDKMARCRRAVLETITVEDIGAICRKLIERAVEGHFPAAKLYLSYLFGAPGRHSIVEDLGETFSASAVTQRKQTVQSAPTQAPDQPLASGSVAVTKPMQTVQTARLVTPEQERLFHESLLANPLDTAAGLSILANGARKSKDNDGGVAGTR